MNNKMGERIKARREQLGMSQSELAKITNCSDKSHTDITGVFIPQKKLRTFYFWRTIYLTIICVLGKLWALIKDVAK